MIYVVILYFFLKLPGNVLGAAFNQVRFIVRNLRYLSICYFINILHILFKCLKLLFFNVPMIPYAFIGPYIHLLALYTVYWMASRSRWPSRCYIFMVLTKLLGQERMGLTIGWSVVHSPRTVGRHALVVVAIWSPSLWDMEDTIRCLGCILSMLDT